MRSRISFILARRSPISSHSKRDSAACEGSSSPTLATATTCATRSSSIGARCGAHVRIATPAGYEPDAARRCGMPSAWREETRGKIEILRSPEEAVTGAQAVYTDVWASMGQESEAAQRESAFANYQVNASALGARRSGRCLPALPAGSPRTRSQPKASSIRRARSSATRPKIACTCRRLSCSYPAQMIRRIPLPKESRTCLFRRAGYLHHHSVAEGKLPAAK